MDTINQLATRALIAGSNVNPLSQLAGSLEDGLDLESRDGVEGALWNILTISLVAAIAAAVLFVVGPRVIELGNQAVARIQAPPW
jgi:hypothetical protein